MSDTYTRSNDLSGKASEMVREIKSQAEDLKGRASDAFAQRPRRRRRKPDPALPRPQPARSRTC